MLESADDSVGAAMSIVLHELSTKNNTHTGSILNSMIKGKRYFSLEKDKTQKRGPKSPRKC
jgi:hypothetical protein